MKNPLLSLKQKEHQQALYTVLIVVMLTTLFFLLASLKTPVKMVERIQEEEIEVEFFETETSDPMSEQMDVESNEPDNESANHSSPVVVDKSKENIAVKENPIDNTFGFNSNRPTNTNKGAFGKNNDNNIKQETKDILSDLTRNIVKHPSFKADSQEEGTIALNLWVNAKGEVIKAKLDPTQSNSGSQYLINLAKKAAATILYEGKVGAQSEFVGTKIFTFKKV